MGSAAEAAANETGDEDHRRVSTHDLRQNQVELERHGVSREHIRGADLDSITLSRLDTHYESAVSLARVFIERSFIEDTTARSLPVRSFLVDMNDVFERLVRQLARDIYERQSPTHCVTKETVGHFVKELPENEEFGNSLPPDVVIKNRGEYEAVMDSKWTMTGPKMGHFYQMVAYMP